MINIKLNQNPMPEQEPDVRNHNFLEVAEGYTEEMAINEAMRCLKCRKKPCVGGCPVNIKIPDFIAQIAIGEFEEAYQIISEDSSLPAICTTRTGPVSLSLRTDFFGLFYPSEWNTHPMMIRLIFQTSKLSRYRQNTYLLMQKTIALTRFAKEPVAIIAQFPLGKKQICMQNRFLLSDSLSCILQKKLLHTLSVFRLSYCFA